MITRLRVPLEQPEYSGLLKLAIRELRQPADQLRHILRKELQRHGLFEIDALEADLTEEEPAEKR